MLLAVASTGAGAGAAAAPWLAQDGHAAALSLTACIAPGSAAPTVMIRSTAVADDGKRYLPQLRALDPMPVLGGAGGVSSILNGIVKLA